MTHTHADIPLCDQANLCPVLSHAIRHLSIRKCIMNIRGYIGFISFTGLRPNFSRGSFKESKAHSNFAKRSRTKHHCHRLHWSHSGRSFIRVIAKGEACCTAQSIRRQSGIDPYIIASIPMLQSTGTVLQHSKKDFTLQNMGNCCSSTPKFILSSLNCLISCPWQSCGGQSISVPGCSALAT